MASLKEKVFAQIDSMQDEIVQTTSELVQVRSVNPGYPGVDFDAEIGGETRACEFLKSIYDGMRLEVGQWEIVEGRGNIAAVWKGSGGGQSLLHNGHVDTVPSGLPENWQSDDPFSGKVDDGRVYGRGSCDMKGPIVAQAMAIKALQACGVQLKGDVILSGTAGEENMDSATIGAGTLVKQGYKADAAIVSEASAPPYPLAVVPVSAGLWWVSITVGGKASHASMRAETFRAGGLGAKVAVDAIDKGVFMLNAIRKLENDWGITKRHPLFQPGHFTLLPGVITGGAHGVTVPFFISDYCTIEYCIWYHPDEEPEAVKQEFETYIGRVAQTDSWLREHPPKLDWKVNWPAYKVDEGHPIVKAVVNAHNEAAVGTRFDIPAKIAGFAAVCDCAFLNRDGVPSIVYGPGSILLAHAPDEYVPIDELMTATKTYALVTMNWCGVNR
jgi:acetylornithine deacetylase/succinyl-diaminopimelate desuccinylase family protein